MEKLIVNKEYDENQQIEAELIVVNDKNSDENSCPICDEFFITSDLLDIHMNYHNDVTQLDGNSSESVHRSNEEYQIGVYYSCDKCDSSFSHETNLQEHKKKKHDLNRSKRNKKGRP